MRPSPWAFEVSGPVIVLSTRMACTQEQVVTVRPGGFLRSRPLAILLGVDSTPFVQKRIYRGVQY